MCIFFVFWKMIKQSIVEQSSWTNKQTNKQRNFCWKGQILVIIVVIIDCIILLCPCSSSSILYVLSEILRPTICFLEFNSKIIVSFCPFSKNKNLSNFTNFWYLRLRKHLYSLVSVCFQHKNFTVPIPSKRIEVLGHSCPRCPRCPRCPSCPPSQSVNWSQRLPTINITLEIDSFSSLLSGTSSNDRRNYRLREFVICP